MLRITCTAWTQRYYVESFNNVLNVYHDKKIAFGNDHMKCEQIWQFFTGMKMLIGILQVFGIHMELTLLAPVSSIGRKITKNQHLCSSNISGTDTWIIVWTPGTNATMSQDNTARYNLALLSDIS